MRLNNRGAASILVVLIIVVLATFGGVALTASWNNKNLAIKAAQSKINFYALDSVAEEILAEVDEQLYLAAQQATDCMNIQNDLSVMSDDERFLSLIESEMISSGSQAIETMAIKESFERIYYYYCAILLQQYANNKNMELVYGLEFENPEDFLDTEKYIISSEPLILRFQVSAGDKPGQQNLTIDIGIVCPDTVVEILDIENWMTDFTISTPARNSRYDVLSWKQHQNPIEYEVEPQRFG